MGQGFKYICKKCGKRHDISIGSGFKFLWIYRKIAEQMANGKYGTEWKDLFLSDEHIVIETELALYVCESCHHWSVEHPLSLYIPKNSEFYGRIPWDITPEKYTLLKPFIHYCKNCGEKMSKSYPNGFGNILRCPNCGDVDNVDLGFPYLWD